MRCLFLNSSIDYRNNEQGSGSFFRSIIFFLEGGSGDRMDPPRSMAMIHVFQLSGEMERFVFF